MFLIYCNVCIVRGHPEGGFFKWVNLSSVDEINIRGSGVGTGERVKENLLSSCPSELALLLNSLAMIMEIRLISGR